LWLNEIDIVVVNFQVPKNTYCPVLSKLMYSFTSNEIPHYHPGYYFLHIKSLQSI